jgi:glycosyltransferase involved in cell wall biosynthesis
MKKIVYIGNNLSQKTKYQSTMATLALLLEKEGYKVVCASSKQGKISRLLDMLATLVKHRKSADWILIDTFSTLSFYYAFFVGLLAQCLKLPYILILHGGNLPKRLDVSPMLSKILFRHSFTNITPSHYLEFEFKKRGYVTGYIPNSIDLALYSFAIRNQLRPKLLWVRAFAEIYNPILALQVVAILKEQYPTVELCMVGPDKENMRPILEQKASELNVMQCVTFTGVMENTAWHNLSQEFDIFINTTNADNMPVSVLEAMALGLPVVSTSVGGIPYLIENNQNGVLVTPNNANAMATAVARLIQNPEKSKAMALVAREKVEKLDHNLVIKQWNALLNAAK